MIKTIAMIIVSAFCVTQVNAHQAAFKHVRKKAKKERQIKQSREAEASGAKGDVTKTKLAQRVDLYTFNV